MRKLISAVWTSVSNCTRCKSKPIEIHLRDVSSLQSIAADAEHAIVIGEAFLGDAQYGFLLQHLYEGGAEIEEQVPLLCRLVVKWRSLWRPERSPGAIRACAAAQSSSCRQKSVRRR